MENASFSSQIEHLPIILAPALKSLNSRLEKSDSPDKKLAFEAEKLVQLAQQHLLEMPNEDFKELEKLGNNISNKLNTEDGRNLVKKIKKGITARGLFESVQVDKNLRPDLKNQREKIFWGLGTDWWMQIIDKPYHQFGPEVFDKALHGNNAEPGYLNGVREASDYASKYIGLENSVVHYKEIHRAACHHFEIKKYKSLSEPGNDVVISGEETGQFKRMPSHNASFDMKKLDSAFEYLDIFHKAADPHYKDFYSQNYYNKIEKIYPGINLDLTKSEIIEKKELQFKQLMTEWEQRVATVRSEISTISKEIGLDKPFASIEWVSDSRITLTYLPISQEQLDKAVDSLFDRFNQRVLSLQGELKNSLEQSIKDEDILLIRSQYESDIRQCIGGLFQALEWLHPFPDGQGRTDLILLAKLLTDYGLHPAILEDPYISSVVPFKEWDARLVVGLENWRQEQEKIKQKL